MKANYLLKNRAKEILRGNRVGFAWLSIPAAFFSGLHLFFWFSYHLQDIKMMTMLLDFVNDFNHFFSIAISNLFCFTKIYRIEILGRLFFGLVALVFTVWMMWLSFGLLKGQVKAAKGSIIQFFPFKKPLLFLGAMITQGIYLFFWTLFLIVPGFVKYYSYAMTYFILWDKKVTVDEAITRSRKLMHGHKFKLFLLDMSFFPWHLLNICTLGVTSLWTMPYILTTKAAFYENLIEKKDAK
ncbi:MAG: DUF975 family protein [Lactobacillales bacterium]|jgi:uncharacterized membrane protein|nr:DUF975 family protein [Lactobacillales bacterium]